jgi:CBS domain-containing protein
MKARDVMTSEVVAARADTPTRDVAQLLLDNHISAVPVIDEDGAPIGMVSEGDLVGRDERERQERRDWWLALLAENGSLSPEFLATLRRPVSTAGEIMSSPVVTVDEDTDTVEIARLLQTYRIKRVPVVRDAHLVGIVSRANLLRALVDEDADRGAKPKAGLLAGALAGLDRHFEHRHDGGTPRAPAAVPPDDTGFTVADFRRLVADHEAQEVQHREEMRRSAAEQRRRKVTELTDRHMYDEGWRHLMHEARVAAEHGEKECMLLHFPSQLCGDRGRAINMAEPGWPATLRGEAAELYLRWERDLKPQGFHLVARVLEFPGGMPGDIGLFLVWG